MLLKILFSCVTADCMSKHFHVQGSECSPISYISFLKQFDILIKPFTLVF